DFPTKPKIERQFGSGLEVILREESIQTGPVAWLSRVYGAAAALHGPEDEAGKRMACRAGEAGKRRLAIVERETARERTGFKGVVTIAAELSAELQAVLAAQITESILVNVTLGRVNVLAANAKKWG